MKKLLLFAIAILGLTACGNNAGDVKTTSISLNENSMTMYEGEKSLLVATVNPENAKDKSVSWSSSDSSIVSVDQSGNISALKKGKCNVIAKTNDTGLQANCSIEVNEYVKCDHFLIRPTDFTIDLYGEYQMTINFTPENASFKKLNFDIKDPSIVSIDENGLVKGLKEGKTSVLAWHKDNDTKENLNFEVKEAFDTGLFIGEKPVRYNGLQFSCNYGNYSYFHETNTLIVDKGPVTDRGLTLKTYDNITTSDAESLTNVSFMLSYEGNRPLTIEFIGDININIFETQGYVGFLYVKNNVNVYLNGPGMINSSSLTHSLTYSKKATFFMNDLRINLNCESLCYGICTNTARFSSCSVDIRVDKDSTKSTNYSCLYIGNGISASSTHFDLHGFKYGAYTGTSYLYDCYFGVTATYLGVNFYALTTYDSEIIVISSLTGAAFYDGLYMTRGSIYCKSEREFAISSREATLLFDNVKVNAFCTTGIGLVAWRILCENSTIKAEVDDGYALQCNYNSFVGENEKAKIVVINTSITANVKNEGCAIWGIGLFEMELSTFDNGEKYLFEDILIKYTIEDQVFAICDKNASKLEYEVYENLYIPTNGIKSLSISKTY